MGGSETSTSVDGARAIASYEPATGKILGKVDSMGPPEVRAAVERARIAQEAWRILPIEERCARIIRFRDAIVDRAESIVELISRESGKPRIEALLHEVMFVADLATYLAKNAARILAPRDVELRVLRHRRSYVLYAPHGVVAVISPWNFPFAIPLADTLTALVAGNAVVIKPSELTPLVALRAKEVYDEAGLPDDLLQIVTGGGSTGVALIDAGPDKVCFTGGVNTGRLVGAACGERLIPCTLELGGKAAAIVCADADVERAARAIVWGGFANSGQACVSVERVFAHASVYESLAQRVTQLTAGLRQGDPGSPTTDIGAITFPPQFETIERLLADATAKGAKVAIGGHRQGGRGESFAPTVLLACTSDMDVMWDEIFGPVIPMMRVKDEEEAVTLTNRSRLGLMNYVFTRDRDRGRRLAERLRSGTVMINDVVVAYGASEVPFGGVRDSGYGRIHGEEGLREMCEVRHVNYDRIPVRRELQWFPYSERTYRAALKGMKLLFKSGSPVKRLLDLF